MNSKQAYDWNQICLRNPISVPNDENLCMKIKDNFKISQTNLKGKTGQLFLVFRILLQLEK